GGRMIPLAVSRTRRPVVGHFCALHALGAADAVRYDPPTPQDRRTFDDLRVRGIVHEAIARHYWIDLVALKADEDARRARLVWPVIGLSLLAAALLLLYRG